MVHRARFHFTLIPWRHRRVTTRMPTGEEPRESHLLRTPLYPVTGRGSWRPVKIFAPRPNRVVKYAASEPYIPLSTTHVGVNIQGWGNDVKFIEKGTYMLVASLSLSEIRWLVDAIIICRDDTFNWPIRKNG